MLPGAGYLLVEGTESVTKLLFADKLVRLICGTPAEAVLLESSTKVKTNKEPLAILRPFFCGSVLLQKCISCKPLS